MMYGGMVRKGGEKVQNILLVDDESMVRIGVRTCVDWKSLNIDKVYEASNGSEALEIVRNNRIDIIITDIKMSVMDGFAMLDELKEMEHKPEVIVMSCYNDYENMRQAMSYGVKDFLFKPKMYPEDIAEAVCKVQREMNVNEDGIEKRLQEILNHVELGNYLEQFENMLKQFETSEIELPDAIRYVVEYLNNLMRLDDTSDSVLHEFSTVLFGNLYAVRQCRKIDELLRIMRGIIERIQDERGGKKKDILFSALQFIDIHLADADLCQEMVAEHIGLSVSYFCRFFKNEMGMSYSNYIIKKRIELAEQLYKTTDMKVYEIARRVGYSNERYFARLYKEQTGHSMKNSIKKEKKE